MKCPKCEIVELTMADRSGVEIDYCTACRGVWLDRGELDKIIERAALQFGAPDRGPEPAPPQNEREYDRSRRWRDDDDDDDDDYRHGRRKRRGGFLGELFDF